MRHDHLNALRSRAIRITIGLAYAGLIACVPLQPMLFAAATSSAPHDSAEVSAKLVALGYVVKIAQPSLVTTEWSTYEEEKKTGDYKLPVREMLQVTLAADGVVTLSFKAECDWNNVHWTSQTSQPSAWKACEQSKIWPMAKVKANYDRILLELGLVASPASHGPGAADRSTQGSSR